MRRKFNPGDLCLYNGEEMEVTAVGTSVNKQPLCLIGGRFRKVEPYLHKPLEAVFNFK